MFNGKPILSYSIDLCLRSNIFDRVIVSTDDYEIKKIAMAFGAEVHERNRSLSDDKTPIVPVMKNVLEELELNDEFIYSACIFPCAPIIFMSDLLKAYDKAFKGDKDFIYPVTEFSHPIQRAIKVNKSFPEFVEPRFELTPTQKLEKHYHDAGQFYIGKNTAWLKEKKMHTDGICLKIPNWRVVDIDNEDDWFRAQLVYNVLKKIHPDEL